MNVLLKACFPASFQKLALTKAVQNKQVIHFPSTIEKQERKNQPPKKENTKKKPQPNQNLIIFSPQKDFFFFFANVTYEPKINFRLGKKFKVVVKNSNVLKQVSNWETQHLRPSKWNSSFSDQSYMQFYRLSWIIKLNLYFSAMKVSCKSNSIFWVSHPKKCNETENFYPSRKRSLSYGIFPFQMKVEEKIKLKKKREGGTTQEVIHISTKV